jgi:hypothetical protein
LRDFFEKKRDFFEKKFPQFFSEDDVKKMEAIGGTGYNFYEKAEGGMDPGLRWKGAKVGSFTIKH